VGLRDKRGPTVAGANATASDPPQRNFGEVQNERYLEAVSQLTRALAGR
jgi:hypothetical protein